jgi:hypothetical protein
MAAQTGKLVFVTGFKELDAKLGTLEPKVQRKFVRGALRKGGKRLTKEIQRIVREEAYDTGALYRTLKVQSLKRRRGRVGIAVMPPRERLFANYAKKHAGKQPHPAKGSEEPFYYVSVIEFGDDTHEPKRPMRRALYDNAAVFRAYFEGDMKQFIAEQKVTTALPKSQGYTGRKAK